MRDLTVEARFPVASQLPELSPADFQGWVYWGLVFLEVQIPRAEGCLVWILSSSPPREDFMPLISLLMSLAVEDLFYPSLGRPQEGCSICSYSLGVCMGGGKLRIVLLPSESATIILL